MQSALPKELLGLILKVGLFVFLALTGLVLFGWMLLPLAGYMGAAATATFATAAVANTVSLRIFERAQLHEIGLGWAQGSARNLGIGLLAGLASAVSIIAVALVFRLAIFERSAEPGSWSRFLFVSIALLFGAAGEEMLFRGYGFQVLCARAGRMATLLPVSVIFGLAHTSNENASLLGIVNTVGFGIVLGYAFLRSGDLWLPIGIHYGWNWVLPLAGVNLSGFTMGVTGWELRWSAADIWSGGAYGPEASVLTCGVIVGLVLFLRKAPVAQHEPLLLRSDAEN